MILAACWGEVIAADETPAAFSEQFPLRAALGAMGRGDVGDAHHILRQMARRGSAKTLAELQASAGYGRVLLPLFDALGAALTAEPTEHRVSACPVCVCAGWAFALLLPVAAICAAKLGSEG